MQQGRLEITLVQRNTRVKIIKLEINFTPRFQSTRGNLPVDCKW